MTDIIEVKDKLDGVKNTIDEIWDDLPKWMQKFYQVDINSLLLSVEKAKKRYGKD